MALLSFHHRKVKESNNGRDIRWQFGGTSEAVVGRCLQVLPGVDYIFFGRRLPSRTHLGWLSRCEEQRGQFLRIDPLLDERFVVR
jgi:hypothetical protein